MTVPPLCRIAAAALSLFATSLAVQAQSVQVENLCACWVSDLSDDGNAATGQMNGSFQVFRWTRAAGRQLLGRNQYLALQGQMSGMPAISGDGSTVAATILDSTRTHATQGRWTVAGGWQQLAPPLPADGGEMDREDSSVYGISRDGNIVTGLYWRPGQSGGSAHGSVWSAVTGMVGMATEGGSSRIDDANRDGSVLVGWEEDPVQGFRRAAVWVHGVRTILETGTDWSSEAEAVNADGTIVVGQAVDPVSQREEAVKWTWNGSTWTKQILGIGPGATSSGSAYASGVSDDGTVVVGMYRNKFSTFSSGGFVWTAASGLVDAQGWLQTQGVDIKKHFEVTQVSAISADGRVLSMVGTQTQPPYGTHTLLVTRLDAARTRSTPE